MARKIANYTVKNEGRDKGKLFLITEMSAKKAEDWAMRALFALMASNSNIPADMGELGMAGLAEVGLRQLSGLPVATATGLMNELLNCVEYIPDPKKTHVRRELIDDDIEEVETLFTLKWEVLKLHVDFSRAGELSASTAKMLKQRRPNTETSQK